MIPFKLLHILHSAFSLCIHWVVLGLLGENRGCYLYSASEFSKTTRLFSALLASTLLWLY